MTALITQPIRLEVVKKKGKRANTKRVEAALTDWAKQDIKLARRVKRDVYYIAREHQCSECLVLQLDIDKLRAEFRDLRAMLFPPPAARKEAA